MKIELTPQEMNYIKEVMLFHRMIDHNHRNTSSQIIVKLDAYLTKLKEIMAEDKEDKKYRKKIAK